MEQRRCKPLQEEASLKKGKGHYQRKLALERAFLHPEEYL
jgi:stalled ribosome alternative rescue factor ArfA